MGGHTDLVVEFEQSGENNYNNYNNTNSHSKPGDPGDFGPKNPAHEILPGQVFSSDGTTENRPQAIPITISNPDNNNSNNVEHRNVMTWHKANHPSKPFHIPH